MKVRHIGVIFIVSFIFINAFCQKYANSQFTLYSYTFNIDPIIKNELSTLENYIKYNPENKQDKVEGMLIHSLYNMINIVLTDTLGIYLLPVNSLTSKAKYSIYGYPDITIQRALKLADTKYFLKINASLENDISNKKGKKSTENIFKPKLIIKIDIFNKYGYLPIQTSESMATAIEPIILSPEYLAGMNFIDNSIKKMEGIETLKDIYIKAIIEAVLKIKYKGNK